MNFHFKKRRNVTNKKLLKAIISPNKHLISLANESGDIFVCTTKSLK